VRDLRGRVFGAYRLGEPLASGGMGQIFRADAVDGSGRTAAVKVLHGLSPQADEQARFEREARAALKLRHPNIVEAWEFGRAPDGTPFLVMELLRGQTLRARIDRRGPLDAGEVVRVGRGAGAALAYAHREGVVHRDLKPENVFLQETDGNGWTVKLLDFGLALLVEERVRLTAVGITLGTPSYMSPEQVRGQHEESAVTDVWGLGAVLYHALSGRAPFEAETAFAELVRVLADEPTPLDVLRPDVPPELLETVTRALLKDPRHRFPTMDEMIAALPAVGADTDPSLPAVDAAGAPVAPAEPPAAPRARIVPPPQPLPALLDEVRLVSVVVADGLFDQRPFGAAIRAQRGHAEALPGGRAVGLFGGRAWEGDEPERAVAAALQAAATAPQARLGVGTGRALRRAGDAAGGGEGAGSAVTGAAVASAERAAVAGGVGLDDETARRVRGGFTIEPFDGGRQVAREAKPQVGVIGIRGLGGREIPTVGRAGEVARLAGVLDDALRARRARAALILGPQGIGKSRLRYELEVLIEERPERIAYVQGRGEATGTGAAGAYGAFAHALRRRARIPLGVPRSVARERLVKLMRSAIADPEEADGAAGFVGEILGANFAPTPALLAARADATLMRLGMRGAIERYLRALAAQMPLVVAMEDLQWLDPSSLELLERIPGLLATSAVLVVGTARLDALADYPDLLGAAAERIELGPLDEADTVRLLRALLETEPPVTLARRLHALSGGNPYFLEELALNLRERGSDAAAAAGGAIELPSTVQGTVQSRLDRLPSEEKELLKRAAVYGARFWQEGLEPLGVAGGADALARLRRRELLASPRQADTGGLHEWAFRNPIVREVAYSMLTEEQRRRLHGAAGAWLAGHLEERPADAAEHFEAAGETDEAAPRWAAAAEQAARRGETLPTLALSDRALAHPEALDAARRLRLLLARDRVFAILGRRDDQEGGLVEAEALLEEPGVEPGERGEVALRWAWLYRATGRSADARAAAERTLALAPRGATRAFALAALSSIETHRGGADEGAALAEQAIVAAEEARDDGAVIGALQARAIACARQGDLAGALEAFERTADLLQKVGDARGALSARMNLAAGRVRLGRFAEARDALEGIVAEARAAGHAQAHGFALVNLGMARWRAGAGDAATAEAAQQALADAVAVASAAQLPRMWITALLYRSTIALERGDVAAARADAESACRLAAGIKEGLEAEARTALGAALLASGDARGALAEGVAAMALRTRGGGMEELEANLYLLLGDALGALGDGAQAEELLAQGREVLLARAARIADPDARAGLLGAHPAHRALLVRTGGIPDSKGAR
jgi:tetratricopeptide (TPR) repeat protein